MPDLPGSTTRGDLCSGWQHCVHAADETGFAQAVVGVSVLDRVLAEVRRSNLTKSLAGNGTAIKGSTYEPPDLG